MFRKSLAEELQLTKAELDFLDFVAIPNVRSDNNFFVLLPDNRHCAEEML